jgi:redox-sensitive bicupin YhaK (pirin superfamily)
MDQEHFAAEVLNVPAVTADTMSLPRLPALPIDTRWRPLTAIVPTVTTYEGEGFQVRRPFPGPQMALADPFLLLDHIGAVEYAPGEAKGTPWHPHRGFETVTYIMDGAFEHQDSTGGGGLITNGATQWMTAGAGILHIEKPPETLVQKGGLFHGVQLWVNLPAENKMLPPRYQDLEATDVGLIASEDGASLLRVIAGEIGGVSGPGQTFTPITYLHATVRPGTRVAMPWNPEFNAYVYALNGDGLVGVEPVEMHEGEMAVFGEGDALMIEAAPDQPGHSSEGWDVLVLGGKPIGEQIARYGPFVMNTHEEIVQAVEDYRAGRLGSIPASSV